MEEKLAVRHPISYRGVLMGIFFNISFFYKPILSFIIMTSNNDVTGACPLFDDSLLWLLSRRIDIKDSRILIPAAYLSSLNL